MTAKKRGLGRGVDALLDLKRPRAKSTGAGGATGAEFTVDVKDLKPNRLQPRSEFDSASLAGLAASIAAQGVVQPIVVTPRQQGGYTIVAGERRWRAARQAGLDKVPAVVREVADDRDLLEIALVENLQRSDLNPIEEAEAYDRLRREFKLTQVEVAARVGKSRAAVANTVRLLGLPSEVQDLLRAGQLSAGQARPLLGLDNADEQVRWARRALREGLTARSLERTAAGGKEAKKKKGKIDPDTEAAAEKLTKILQTKVEIRRQRKGGTVRISFHSEEELMRIYERLAGKS